MQNHFPWKQVYSREMHSFIRNLWLLIMKQLILRQRMMRLSFRWCRSFFLAFLLGPRKRGGTWRMVKATFSFTSSCPGHVCIRFRFILQVHIQKNYKNPWASISTFCSFPEWGFSSDKVTFSTSNIRYCFRLRIYFVYSESCSECCLLNMDQREIFEKIVTRSYKSASIR